MNGHQSKQAKQDPITHIVNIIINIGYLADFG